MNKLETVNRSGWEVVVKRVTVVNFGRYKSISKKFSRVCIYGFSNLAEKADLVKGGAANV